MPEPSPDAWAQIRYDYEHTDRPLEDICVEHGFTANTLRHRARKWGWMMRRPRIPDEGPPAIALRAAIAEVPALGPRFRGDERTEETTPGPDSEPSPHIGVPIVSVADDSMPIGQRLQGAVARVLPAIEMTLARLSAGPIRPREMETTARALGSLMRTLRELNGLLAQQKAQEPPRRSTEELRESLRRKLEAIIAERGNPAPGAVDV